MGNVHLLFIERVEEREKSSSSGSWWGFVNGSGQVGLRIDPVYPVDRGTGLGHHHELDPLHLTVRSIKFVVFINLAFGSRFIRTITIT